MSIITIHDREFDIDCVVFDKDHTLIDINALWGGRAQRWIDALTLSLGLSDETKTDLLATLGYLPGTASVRPESPLAVSSIETLYTVVAGVLSKTGLPFGEARNLAIDCARDTIKTPLSAVEVKPKGDVAGIMRQLVQANIHVAVVTSDDRSMTEETLAYLGVKDFVSAIICGDDPIPTKPSPEALWLISKQLDINTNRIMMVGDSIIDMRFAANAGAAYRVGVASLSADNALLSAQADLLISSVDEIIIGL